MNESTIKQYSDEMQEVTTESTLYQNYIASGKGVGTAKTKAIIKFIVSNKLSGAAQKATALNIIVRAEFQVKAHYIRCFTVDYNMHDDYTHKNVKASNDNIIKQFEGHEDMCATADKRIQMFMKAIDGLG